MTSEPVLTSKHPGYKPLTVSHHFLYFPTASQRAAFVKAAAQKGFGNINSFVSVRRPHADGAARFVVHLTTQRQEFMDDG